MKDFASNVRKAYFTLLTGQITYNGDPIPVYDEMTDVNEDMYIILSTQQDINESNKHSFQTNHTITIDIVTKFLGSARKYPSEDIAEQIMELILPTPQTTGLVAPVGLQFAGVRLLDSISIPVEQFDNYKIVRKVLRLEQKIIQL